MESGTGKAMIAGKRLHCYEGADISSMLYGIQTVDKLTYCICEVFSSL
jgi:hypothetical protein